MLSLFFIDSVEKYRVYGEDNEAQLGEYGKIFEEEYKDLVASLELHAPNTMPTCSATRRAKCTMATSQSTRRADRLNPS